MKVTLTNEGRVVNPTTTNVRSTKLLDLRVAESEEEKLLDGSRQPWFILEAQNQWCEVGQRATFEAQVTGKPMPMFRWYVLYDVSKT